MDSRPGQIEQNGFTLIEMVTVITIVGVLAVIMIPRFIQPSNFESRTVSDQLISSARQAQQLAMSKAAASNVTWSANNGTKRIRIQYSENGTQTIDISIPDNISITNSSVQFLKNGAASISSQVVITITPNPRNVCIEITGYAHAC